MEYVSYIWEVEIVNIIYLSRLLWLVYGVIFKKIGGGWKPNDCHWLHICFIYHHEIQNKFLKIVTGGGKKQENTFKETELKKNGDKYEVKKKKKYTHTYRRLTGEKEK